MAIGICPRCQRRFVVEDPRSFQRTCPACLRPMQLPGPTAGAAVVAEPPGNDQRLWLNDLPLSADDGGQRVMAALAEAAYQCAASRAQRQAACDRRAHAAPAGAEEEQTRSPAAIPPAKEAPPREPGHEAMPLAQQVVALAKRAETVCLDAKIVQGRSRLLRENRQSIRDPSSLLPPLDYRLPPLAEDAGELKEMLWPGEPRLASARTTLYVWGHTPPQSLLCRERCEATPAAARIATEAGWVAAREGAWAKQITLATGLRETLRELEPLLRQDAAVVGWSARMQRHRGFGDHE